MKARPLPPASAAGLLACALALGFAGALALPDDAWARVGGGESYGRSSGGRSSGGGSGGFGGGEVELLYLLVRLCIEYPAIGVPLLIAVAGVAVAHHVTVGPHTRRVHRTHAPWDPHGAAAPAARPKGVRTAGLERLAQSDPGFSLPVLQSYLALVHRRAYEALGARDARALAPFVDDGALQGLLASNPHVASVSELVLGGVRVLGVDARGGYDLLRVEFESTRVEHLEGGERRRVLVTERWTFRRLQGACSLPPEETERMGCPSCGAAVETTTLGRCVQCDTPITAGQLQWQATGVAVETRRVVTPPPVGLVQGGRESSYDLPTRVAPDLAARMRELMARHPDFELSAFRDRVEKIYTELQAAWSEGRWEAVRPWVTDHLFQTLRFWMERYTRHGLQNRLTDVRLHRIEVVSVGVDAWYESVTVRIWGSMTDCVVDASGRVVGGNPRVPREFSEYWTFLRASGTGGAVHDAHRCPSCGAPLDRVNQAGICGYCDSKITTGRFDWVLSRIDQPEAYAG